MRYPLLFFGIFLLNVSCYAQKHQENVIDAESISGINISSDDISSIEVITDSLETIRISSGIDGETYESMLINTEVVDGILNIRSGRTPFYEAFDDKLAAHKVLAVALKLRMPEDLELLINSAIAKVNLTGVYKYVNLNLDQGDCMLRSFSGNGIIYTRSGAIKVYTRETKVEANSRQGEISVEKSKFHTYDLLLKSLTGAIIVRQSE